MRTGIGRREFVRCIPGEEPCQLRQALSPGAIDYEQPRRQVRNPDSRRRVVDAQGAYSLVLGLGSCFLSLWDALKEGSLALVIVFLFSLDQFGVDR